MNWTVAKGLIEKSVRQGTTQIPRTGTVTLVHMRENSRFSRCVFTLQWTAKNNGSEIMTGGTDVCTGTYITVTVLGTLKARLHCRKTRHGSAGKVFGTTGAYGTGKIMARALKSWYVSFTRKKLPGPFQFLIRAVPSFCSAKERCDGTLIRTMTPKLYTSSMNELEN